MAFSTANLEPQSTYLYRGLSAAAEKEYLRNGSLLPQHGSLSVGRGVFFSNKPEVAETFAHRIIFVTKQELLSPEGDVIDTRTQDYLPKVQAQLDVELGLGR